MAAYVMLEEGKWVNTAEWDGVAEWPLPESVKVVPFGDGVFGWDGNWTYEGEIYSPPEQS